MADTNDLYTTIKNVSGASRYIGYLPPHGRTVANNAEVSVPGDLMEYLRRNRRARLAFEADLTAGRILITRKPAPIVTNPYVGTTVTAPDAPTVGEGASAVGTWTGVSDTLYFALTWTAPGIGETTIGTKSSAYVSTSHSSKAPSITVPTVPTNPAGVVANVYASADGTTAWKQVLAGKAAGAHQFTGAWPPAVTVTAPTTNTLPVMSVAPPQTALTLSGSSSGGTIPAGDYKLACTFDTVWGETSVGSSTAASAVTLTGSTSKITTTLPSVASFPAGTTVNVYCTDATGAASTLKRVLSAQAGGASVSVTAPPAETAATPPATDAIAQPNASQVVGVNSSGSLILVDPSWQK